MLLSLLRVLATVSMADFFVHKPENFQAVITFQPNHFSDLFLDQYFHWTFLSLLIGSSHELLHSALTGTCSSVWTIFGKLHTVKHYLRFNFYCMTNHYVGSKLVCRTDIQKLYLHFPKWSISYNQNISLILTKHSINRVSSMWHIYFTSQYFFFKQQHI